MRYTHDLDADSLYVHLAEGTPATQHEMPDGVIVDLDADGRPLGLDIVGVSNGFDLAAVMTTFGLTEQQTISVHHLVGLVLSHSSVLHVPEVKFELTLV